MTGRPTSFSETDCTAPRPLPLEEESFTGDAITRPEDITLLRRLSSQDSGPSETPSSGVFSSRVRVSPQKSLSPASQSSSQDRKQIIPPSNGLFFRYHTKLSLLNNEVLNCLYRADAMKKSWAHVQGVISTLNSKLEKWRIELPSVFDFTKRQRDQLFVRQRMSLGFFYYSTLTIINRPCLCRLDRKIPNQSTKAKNFNREIAMKCVYSACDMLQMLPDVPNTGGLYKIAPWWCLIHYLMQAATVLMLELSFRAEHMPNEVEGVFDSAKKALVWLRSMSDESEAARRAWSLCNDMLRKVAPKIGRSPNDASNIDSTSIVDNPMSYNDPAEYSGEASGQIQGMDNVPVTQHGQYAPEYSYSGGGFYQPQIFTSYDQFLSYGQVPTTSAVESFGTPFPIANDMDGITFENHDAAGYFQAQNPRWFPGSGA